MNRLWQSEDTKHDSIELVAKIFPQGDSLYDYYIAILENSAVQEYINQKVLTQVTTELSISPASIQYSGEIIFGFYQYIDDSHEGGYVKCAFVKVDTLKSEVNGIDTFSGAGKAASIALPDPIQNPAQALNLTPESINELLQEALEENQKELSSATYDAQVKVWRGSEDFMNIGVINPNSEAWQFDATWSYEEGWQLIS